MDVARLAKTSKFLRRRSFASCRGWLAVRWLSKKATV